MASCTWYSGSYPGGFGANDRAGPCSKPWSTGRMTSLPVPARRPCISSRYRLVRVPGLSEGYQLRISRTREVVSMVWVSFARPNLDRRPGSFKKSPSLSLRGGKWGPAERRAAAQEQIRFVDERGEILARGPFRRQLQLGPHHHAAVAEELHRVLQRGLGERFDAMDAPGQVGRPAAIERLPHPLPRRHGLAQQEPQGVGRHPDSFAEGPEQLRQEREHAHSARDGLHAFAHALGQAPAEEQGEGLVDGGLEALSRREDELVLQQPGGVARAPEQLVVRHPLAAERAE